MTNKNLTLEDFLASITLEDNLPTTIAACTADHTAHVREVAPCHHRRRIDKDALILALIYAMDLQSAKLFAKRALATSDKDMRRKIDYAIKERISARNWQPRVPSAKEDKLMNGSFRRNQPHTASRFRVNRFQ
jgi:hypothetical protein